MNSTTKPKPVVNHDDIAALAWHIWQQDGRVPGRDQENWVKAEQLLRIASQPGKELTENAGAKDHPSLASAITKVLRRWPGSVA